MRNQATAFDITVTVQPGMILAAPEPYAIRLGVQQTAGTVCLAGFVATTAFGLAGQPWRYGANPVVAIPFVVAAILFAISADLFLLSRKENKRLRQSAIMNGLMLGTGITILAGVILGNTLAFPALYPLLFVVFALPIAFPLNIGVLSRISFEPHTWRLISIGCLIAAILLIVGGFVPYQDHVVGQWQPS